MLIYENQPSKIKLLWLQEIFFKNFHLKNECKNGNEDDNEKNM